MILPDNERNPTADFSGEATEIMVFWTRGPEELLLYSVFQAEARLTWQEKRDLFTLIDFWGWLGKNCYRTRELTFSCCSIVLCFNFSNCPCSVTPSQAFTSFISTCLTSSQPCLRNFMFSSLCLFFFNYSVNVFVFVWGIYVMNLDYRDIPIPDIRGSPSIFHLLGVSLYAEAATSMKNIFGVAVLILMDIRLDNM